MMVYMIGLDCSIFFGLFFSELEYLCEGFFKNKKKDNSIIVVQKTILT